MQRVTVTDADIGKATRTQVKASIGIDGISGDGKSGLALEIAHVLEPDWAKINVTDTENNSISLYIGEKLQSGATVPENTMLHSKMSKETGYSPFNYEFFRKRAIKNGCTVDIMDSFTHAWTREGGILSTVSAINEELARKGRKVNAFAAWNDQNVVDGKNLIFDLIRDDKVHVISTLRIKDDYALLLENGKNVVKNVGLKQIQQDGLQYEYDLLLRVIRPASTKSNTPAQVEVLKSRYSIIEKGETYDMDTKLLNALKEYLEKGTSREELDKKLEKDLREGLRKQIENDTTKKKYTVYKNIYKDRKLKDLNLKELRDVNSKFVELNL